VGDVLWTLSKLLVQFLDFVRCQPLGVNHVGERSLAMSAERT
jgi:hypothetical protein